MTTPPDDWDAAYRHPGSAPWDIGRPQPAFVELAEGGALAGDVLDAGCGSGEHALLAAAHGARAHGVDLSPTAIAAARAKAAERGLAATFEVADLLGSPPPVGPAAYDTVVDCGLFHVFDDSERQRYVAALHRALRPGGTLYLLCFSDAQPGDWGPRRVSRAELASAFAAGWTVRELRPASLDINPGLGIPSAAAWLLSASRR